MTVTHSVLTGTEVNLKLSSLRLVYVQAETRPSGLSSDLPWEPWHRVLVFITDSTVCSLEVGNTMFIVVCVVCVLFGGVVGQTSIGGTKSAGNNQTTLSPLKESWSLEEYPNPQTDVWECGRGGKKSWICDPNGILSPREGKVTLTQWNMYSSK